MNDYIYQNPPLVEVVAEIHWQLQKVASIPDGAIDPLYEKCLSAIRKNARLERYRFEERLIPEEVPIEFFANKPIVRLRPAADKWPLFQLGPGLFVTNIVPPYNGWLEFRAVLESGILALLESYPAAGEMLDITQLELRYIDAFRKQHGLDVYSRFLVDSLHMSLQIPPEIVQDSVDGGVDNVVTASRIAFPCKRLPNSRGRISVNKGKAEGEEAALLQFSVTRVEQKMPPDPRQILSWFDAAHEEARGWFEKMTSEPVRKMFGEKKSI